MWSAPRLPFFYRRLLVGIAFVTMAVGANARTTFSLLFPPILNEFGWDRGVTAGIFSFGFLVSARVTPCVGRLMDRRGPMVVGELGFAAMAVGHCGRCWFGRLRARRGAAQFTRPCDNRQCEASRSSDPKA